MKNIYGGIALFILAYFALVVIFEFSLLPYITVAVLAQTGLNVLYTFLAAIILCTVLGIIFQILAFIDKKHWHPRDIDWAVFLLSFIFIGLFLSVFTFMGSIDILAKQELDRHLASSCLPADANGEDIILPSGDTVQLGRGQGHNPSIYHNGVPVVNEYQDSQSVSWYVQRNQAGRELQFYLCK